MPISATSSTTRGHNKCRKPVWSDVHLLLLSVTIKQKRKVYDVLCGKEYNSHAWEVPLPLRLHCTGFSSCCLHRLPPFIPLSSLCRFASWLMLHSHYPESCCRLACVFILSLSLLAFSVIAFAVLYFHSFFSCHSLRDWHSHTDWDAESSITEKRFFFFQKRQTYCLKTKKKWSLEWK